MTTDIKERANKHCKGHARWQNYCNSDCIADFTQEMVDEAVAAERKRIAVEIYARAMEGSERLLENMLNIAEDLERPSPDTPAVGEQID